MRPQSVDFLSRELKEKIRRKTVLVPLDLFVESLGQHTVDRGEIAVQHHATLTDDEDLVFEIAGRGQPGARSILGAHRLTSRSCGSIGHDWAEPWGSAHSGWSNVSSHVM